LFYIYPFKPNGILFPEGFSAPVRNPARLAVKKYRKRSEDDYFTATSPQGRLAGLLRTRGYLCRNEMPLSPYPVFTVSYCRENPF